MNIVMQLEPSKEFYRAEVYHKNFDSRNREPSYGELGKDEDGMK